MKKALAIDIRFKYGEFAAAKRPDWEVVAEITGSFFGRGILLEIGLVLI